jgi:hypothetical protein
MRTTETRAHDVPADVREIRVENIGEFLYIFYNETANRAATQCDLVVGSCCKNKTDKKLNCRLPDSSRAIFVAH